VSWEGHYTTDVIAEKAYGFIDDAVALGDPFFLTVATVAPHSNVAAFELDLDDPLNSPLDSIVGVVTPPIPAERHKHLFPEVKVPRTANFNPNKVSIRIGHFLCFVDRPLLAQRRFLDQSSPATKFHSHRVQR